MSTREPFDVAVVGAGPVGAALALALARDGWRIALVEQRAPEPVLAETPLDIRVSALAPRSRRLLEELGVWSACATRAQAYTAMEVCDAHSPGRLRFDAAEYGWAELGHIVENRLLSDRLWQALAQESRVRVHCPAQIESLQHEAGITQLGTSTGVLRARLVVGADGAASRVRELLGLGFAGRDYAERGLVAHVLSEQPHGAVARQRFLASGPIALLPLVDGRCSIVWTLPEAEAQRQLAFEPAQFEAALTRASDGQLGRLRLDSARAAFALQRRSAPRFIDAGVALVGDAAHQVHPLAGQGMNLGFDDVLLLRQLLAAARAAGRAAGSASDLRRYERERRSEAAIAAQVFEALHDIYRPHQGPLAVLRGIGMRAIDTQGWLKKLLAQQAAG